MTDAGTFTHAGIRTWTDEIAALTRPDRIVICDGSEAEKQHLIAESVATGELIELNQQKLPGCYLHRSAPHDVARTEHLTFVCTDVQDDAGPNNNWMAPGEAKAKLTPLFNGCMAGRTMYVVPFLMGPKGSRFSKVGVEITDSRYVVLSMRIMTRMGQIALDHLGDIERLHALPALARRLEPRSPLHHALSRVEHGVVDRVGLRRQCAAWQEMHGAPAGELDGEKGRLAGRAHADPRPAESGRPDASRRRCLSVGVRQDQPGDARTPGVAGRLESVHCRRRHRLAATGLRRTAVGGESRGRILRGGAGDEPQDEPHGVRDEPAQHDLHQRRAAARRHAMVGRT